MNASFASKYSSSKFCRKYFNIVVYLFVFNHFSSSFAGSYEDYFSAVKSDDAPAIRALLKRGFDGNVRDPQGDHALHVAIRDSSAKAVQVLLSWEKVEIEARNKVDESPLMLAALGGQTDIVKGLIERDADVNKTGWTALHYAATRGHLDVLRLLLDKSAYIDAASPNGTTPLMMAAFYGTPSAVKLLLEAGADPFLKNRQDLTAIDFAQRANRAEAAEIIAAFVRAKQPKGKW